MSDQPKLRGVHPLLIERISRVLAAMGALGFPMRVVQGVRTTAEQQALFAQGRTTPGAIVTNADGVNQKSNHQAKADGLGYAVDCAFFNDPTTPIDETWAETSPWAAYGACVKAVGLAWGGDFVSLVDRPHAELRL